MPGPAIAMIVVFVAVAAFALWSAARRRKELRAWATARGLRFVGGHDSHLDDRYPLFKCLRHGSRRRAYNIVEGTWRELPVKVFDYRYETGSGKNRSTHHFSALILRSPIPLKPLTIRPENFLDKIGEFIGIDDIDFESAEFSRKFHVGSPNRRWAYDVIHTRAMEFLLQSPTFSMAFGAHEVIAWRSRRMSPADFDAALDVIHGLFDLMPDYLVRQQTSGATRTLTGWE